MRQSPAIGSSGEIEVAMQNVENVQRPVATPLLWRIAVVALALCPLAAAAPVVDPDLWGHLRFGLDHLHTGKLAAVDPYSYTAGGLPWINHEWLFELTLAAFYSLGGVIGLVLLHTIFTLAIGGLLLRRLRRAGLPLLRAAILLVFASWSISGGTTSLRPSSASYLLTAVELLLVVSVESGDVRLVWVFPLLFAFWANVHGAFLFGMALFLAWSPLHCWFHRSHVRVVLPATLLSVVATCLNPYGIHLVIFLLRTATVPRPEITEWSPLTFTSREGLAYLLVLAPLVASIVTSRRPRNLALLAPLALATVAPLTAIRHLPLFAVAALILGAEHFSDAWERLEPYQEAYRAFAAPVLFVGIVAFTAYGYRGGFRFASNDNVRFPAGAVSLLKNRNVTANMATPFNWGEYVIWHLGPGVRVSMDGRRETVYSDALRAVYMHFRDGEDPWDKMLVDYPTDLVLTEKDSATYSLLRLRPDWTLVYEDRMSALFAKTGSTLAETLREGSAEPRVGDGLGFP